MIAVQAGVIRSQDVRTTDIDRVVIHECFRPGDIVRGEVLSFGDNKSYFVTTARLVHYFVAQLKCEF